MSYEDLNIYPYRSSQPLYGVSIQYEVKNNNKNNKETIVSGTYIEITDKYKNTLKWLKENGF